MSTTVSGVNLENSTAVTPSPGDNSTKIATTAFVQETQPFVTPNFVTGSRAVNGGPYQNNSGSTMFVIATGSLNLGVGHTGSYIGNIGPTSGGLSPVDRQSVTNSSGFCSTKFMVPPGYWYSVTSSTGTFGETDIPVLANWVEWT